MSYELDPGYKEVPERIADLKAIHPDAVLRPVDPANPFEVREIGERTFIVYTAACYRTPDDPLPAIGCAWEPFPGKTPYTKDSELMNAETSAWGRAIVAALRSESKAIASAQDVRNRQADQVVDPPQSSGQGSLNAENPTPKQMGMIRGLMGDLGMSSEDARRDACQVAGRDVLHLSDLTKAEASSLIDLWKAA